MGEKTSGQKIRDEQGRFVSPDSVPAYREITVWDLREGDVLKVLRDASERDLRQVQEQYDEPWHNIEIEHYDTWP